MTTSTTGLENIAARLDKLERQNRWLKRAGAALLLFAGATLLIGAQAQPNSKKTVIPGWVIVEKNPNEADNTKTIQDAIDSLPDSGGVVFFPAGTYQHKGLKGRANVHLKGVHSPSVILDYTPATGDGITFSHDPDHFAISELTLTSSGKSKGWALRADQGTQRYIRLHRVNIVGFLNGVFIANSINVSFDQCHIGGTYPKDPQGIGIQVGDGTAAGGNAVTIQDCYFNSLDKGVVTYAQAALILRPILELCHVGVETHGTTTLVQPWVDGTATRSHVSIQPNTVGGGRSGTGALLVGYGSSNVKTEYGTDTERQRTIIIPERHDLDPGDDPQDRHGIKLGSVIIDRDGVVHLKDMKKTP